MKLLKLNKRNHLPKRKNKNKQKRGFRSSFLFINDELFGGEEEFEKLKVRDDIKNKWCSVNGVEMIRFNYLQKKEDIHEQLENIIYKIEEDPEIKKKP
jgi:hypothetical protein